MGPPRKLVGVGGIREDPGRFPDIEIFLFATACIHSLLVPRYGTEYRLICLWESSMIGKTREHGTA